MEQEKEINVIIQNLQDNLAKVLKNNFPNNAEKIKTITKNQNYFINSLQTKIKNIINNENHLKETITSLETKLEKKTNEFFTKFNCVAEENKKLAENNRLLLDANLNFNRMSIPLSRSTINLLKPNNRLTTQKPLLNQSFGREMNNQELNKLYLRENPSKLVESNSSKEIKNPFNSSQSEHEAEPKSPKKNKDYKLTFEKIKGLSFNNLQPINQEDSFLSPKKNYQNIITKLDSITINPNTIPSETLLPEKALLVEEKIDSEIQQKITEDNKSDDFEEFEDALELNDLHHIQYTFSLSNANELSQMNVDILDITGIPLPLLIWNDKHYQSTLHFTINEKESSPLFTFVPQTFKVENESYNLKVLLKIKSSQPVEDKQTIRIQGTLSNKEDNIEQEISFSFQLTNNKKLIINKSLKLEFPDKLCGKKIKELLDKDKRVAHLFEIEDIKKSIKEAMGELDKALLILYQ